MLFPVTDTERAAVEAAEAAQKLVQEKGQALRRFGYNRREDDPEFLQAQADFLASQADANRLAESEEVLTAAFKMELNKSVADKLPGGSPAALLGIAEQTLLVLDGEHGQRLGGILKSLAVRFFEMGAVPEVAVARAKGTKARYDALLEVGLPEPLVRDIIVAEASRPLPGFPVRASSSSR